MTMYGDLIDKIKALAIIICKHYLTLLLLSQINIGIGANLIIYFYSLHKTIVSSILSYVSTNV